MSCRYVYRSTRIFVKRRRGIWNGSHKRQNLRVVASKQIVQQNRLAPLVFLKSFAGHAADHIAFLGKALLPVVFVGERRQNLRCNRILFIRRQGARYGITGKMMCEARPAE